MYSLPQGNNKIGREGTFEIINIYNSMKQNNNNNNNLYLPYAKTCFRCFNYFILYKFHRNSWQLDIISPFWKIISRWTGWGSKGFSKTCTNAQPMQRRVGFGMQHYLILMFILFQINALRKMVSLPFIEHLYAWHYSECFTSVSQSSQQYHDATMTINPLWVKQRKDRKIK